MEHFFSTVSPHLTSKIAVLDTGVGGLSLLPGISGWINPDEWIYFAHNQRGHFGNKPLAEILVCLREIIGQLQVMGVRHIILACNTACCAAMLGGLEAEHPDLRFSYVLKAGARAAVRGTPRRIGVLATQFTTDSGLYPQTIARYAHNPEIEVYTRALPALAKLIDHGLLDSLRVTDLLTRACLEMQALSVDTLILGCTHFSFCAPILRRLLWPGVRIVDPAQALAIELTPSMASNPGLSRRGSTAMRFFASGDPMAFSREASRLLGHPVVATRLPLMA